MYKPGVISPVNLALKTIKNMTNFIDKKYTVKVLRNVQYGVGGIHHTTAPRQRALCLDVYLPELSAQDQSSLDSVGRPALIMAFGGAFHRGSKEADEFDNEGHRNTPVSTYCNEFARRGYVTFSIDYRLVQEDPDPGSDNVILDKSTIKRSRMDHVRKLLGLEPATTEMLWSGMEAAFNDMRQAYEYVAAHVTDYGIDPSRIAVGGFSAGARMAACATYGKNIPAAAVVALSGMLGMDDAKRLILPGGTYAPALIVVGENDLDYVKTLGEESHAYFDQRGVTNELWEVPGGTHFYPASSLVHKGGVPTVTSQLEPVIADFLYRALRLSELS